MRYMVILLICLNLQAHSLKVFTSTKDDTLFVKAYFSTASACMDCDVNITTLDNKNIYKKTDKDGKLTIPLSLKPVKITVNASLGHKKTVDIKHNFTTKSPYPFWLRLLFGFILIGLFFYFFRLLKKR